MSFKSVRSDKNFRRIKVATLANTPILRIKTTVIFACVVIFTFQTIGIGIRAYSQSESMVMTERAYAALTISSPEAQWAVESRSRMV